MSRPPKPPIFLQRANYRQRRIRDAAKLLPVVGAILWMLPLGWGGGDASDPVSSAGVIYIFAVWVALIIMAAVLSNLIRAETASKARDDSGR